jgi:hypothetical protein
MPRLLNQIKGLPDRWRKASRLIRNILISIALLLVAMRLALPFVLKAYVNKQLDKIPEYAGELQEVDVHLWRGAYKIRNLKVVKTTGPIPVPFFSTPAMDLSIQWKELFHGAIVGEVLLEKPQLNFVAAPSPEQSQTGMDKSWGKTLEKLFPFKINRFEIKDGQIHFRDFFKSQPVDLFVTNLFAVATNLTNARDLKEKLPSGLKATGGTLGRGNFDIDLKLNVLAPAPTFELNAAVTNVDLVALNDFLKGYGKFDVERGIFSLYTSVASVNGNYEGLVKVLFENLDVFEWEKERKKNVLDIFWQAIVGVFSTTLKNQPKDRLAANIPISGSFTKANVDLWSAIGSLLRNAFVRAIVPRIDRSVHVEEVEQSKKGKKLKTE